jgi:tetratricopeptide (TPR) repeat protein
VAQTFAVLSQSQSRLDLEVLLMMSRNILVHRNDLARLGFVMVVCVMGAVACAATAKPTQQPSPVGSVSHENRVELPPTYVTSTDAGPIAERFEKAKALLIAGKFREAAGAFDFIVGLEAVGRFAAPSLFNAGLAYEGVDDKDLALTRYMDLVQRFPDAQETRPGLVRMSRILTWQEDWPALGSAAERLIAYADLAPMDRIEALGALALSQVEQGHVETALSSVSRARTIIEDNRFDDGGRLSVTIAQVLFASGEVLRLRGEKIGFNPVPSNFGQALEERCQLLLDAQDAYASAMRAYDSHWSAMSGYRVGQLYQQLHRDLMGIPAPASATTEKRKQLFEGAMRLRYRVLLEKGLQMMDRTLRMAERTGEQSSWVARAKQAKVELERDLDDEKAALRRLPYTEADLQRALDDLAGKSPVKKP